jgi:uncharacterized delta-60 repeat protein
MIKKLLFFVLFVSTACYSQSWIKTINGSGNGDDKAYAITVDNAGNIYVGGYLTMSQGNPDMHLAKYNSNGTLQWQRPYPGPGNGDDKVYAITVDKLNNVIVTGYSTGMGSGPDMTTIKFSSNGTQQWVHRYPAPSNLDDQANAVAVDDSNNVYVAGYITSGSADYCIIKLNPNGVLQWLRTYNGTGNEDDKVYAITVDQADNIYITGFSTGDTSGLDFVTIKYTRNGQQSWISTYNGPGNSDDAAKDIAIRNSNLYVTGYSRSDTTAGSEDFLTIRYDTDGDTVWTRRYNGPAEAEDKAYAITVDRADNLYVTGYSSALETSLNYTTVKYNKSGERKWVSFYDGTGNHKDIAYDVRVSKNDDFVFVTGSSRSDTLPGSEDIATVKYETDLGEQQQVSRFTGSGNGEDAAFQIAIDTNNNLYLAGYVTSSNTGADWITMKYLKGDLIKVNSISSEVPREFKLYQNYPNPFNPVTTVKFDVLRPGDVKLIVYDILGRQTAVLVNGYLRTGTYEVTFAANSISTGVYFYEMTIDEFRDMKKMVLIK